MCGRFTLTVDANSLQMVFPWLNLPTQEIQPRFNIAPSQPVALVTNDGRQTLDHFSWGLIPFWAKDPKISYKMINARSETLGEKPSFKGALKYRRCLIFADGFYEWKNVPGEKNKVPHYIYLKDKIPFAFAGLWEDWLSPDGSSIKTTTIITTEPNDKLTQIHNRMPVILPEEQYQFWLDTEPQSYDSVKHLFGSFPPDQMDFHPVSRVVNSPANDSPACIQPI